MLVFRGPSRRSSLGGPTRRVLLSLPGESQHEYARARTRDTREPGRCASRSTVEKRGAHCWLMLLCSTYSAQVRVSLFRCGGWESNWRGSRVSAHHAMHTPHTRLAGCLCTPPARSIGRGSHWLFTPLPYDLFYPTQVTVDPLGTFDD